MTQQDMILLVKAQEDILKMDILLKRLTGLGHSNGEFINLDRNYDFPLWKCKHIISIVV